MSSPIISQIRKGPLVLTYGLAILAVLVAGSAQYAAGALLEGPTRFTLLLVPVCFASWLGGFGPGLLALGMSSALGSFLLASPRFSVQIEDPRDLASLILYAVVGGTILYFGEAHRRDRLRLEQSEAEIRQVNGQLEEANAQLEARVAERTAELQTANALMESFCYSVAHDFRTALISISANAGLALHDDGDCLQPEVRSRLERVSEGTNRLSGLMDELLMHARLAQRPLVRQRLDVTALARQEASRLERGTWPCRTLEFRIQEGMAVEGDAALIGIVLHNLMENACKFSSEGSHQVVEVTQAFDADRPIEIRDHGIGFDQGYAHRLFRPFERLMPSYPGAGMGLANARRIVERHGGRVWAEGQEGEGAAFFFTLPLLAVEATVSLSDAPTAVPHPGPRATEDS